MLPATARFVAQRAARHQCVAARCADDNSHLAHQTVHQSRIGRQIFKIEPHVRFYSNPLIRRSELAIFYASFCVVSARKDGPPDALGLAPVNAFNQHRELRGRKGDAAFEPHRPRPHEPALINPLGEQTEPVAVRRGEGPVISFEGKAVKSVRTAWRQARKRAGLDSSVTLYSWRHTLSRWMRSHGVDKWEVQGQLGHRGGVTERYAEYAPDYQAKATAAIELFWNRVVGDSSGTVRWTMSAKYLISWCRLRGLNSRPSVYKTAALPLS
jgi:hypothetical protein